MILAVDLVGGAPFEGFRTNGFSEADVAGLAKTGCNGLNKNGVRMAGAGL